MRTYREWYSNSFSNATVKNACGISLTSLLNRFTQYYLVAMAKSLDKSEDKVQIDHSHSKCFHTMKKLQKSVQYILRYSTRYSSFFGRVVLNVHKWAVSSGVSLLDQIHEIFMGYRGIIFAVNAHWGSDIPFRFGMPERQMREVCHFSTKLVVMATSLEISQNDVEIDHLHPKCFHSVKMLRKSVQRILR